MTGPEEFTRADLDAARENWLDDREQYGNDDERTAAALGWYQHVLQTRLAAADGEQEGES